MSKKKFGGRKVGERQGRKKRLPKKKRKAGWSGELPKGRREENPRGKGPGRRIEAQKRKLKLKLWGRPRNSTKKKREIVGKCGHWMGESGIGGDRRGQPKVAKGMTGLGDGKNEKKD